MCWVRETGVLSEIIPKVVNKSGGKNNWGQLIRYSSEIIIQEGS
jgi:hypothetical protein